MVDPPGRKRVDRADDLLRRRLDLEREARLHRALSRRLGCEQAGDDRRPRLVKALISLGDTRMMGVAEDEPPALGECGDEVEQCGDAGAEALLAGARLRDGLADVAD